MENKVLTENLIKIANYDSKLANEILMFNIDKSNIELAQNENGEYNLLFNSVPIHSTISALEEAKNICKNSKENKPFKIIYGLGLGYLVDEFSKNIQDGIIIVYEPNIDLLKYVLSIAQIDALNQKNIFLCSNKEKLEEYSKKYLTYDSNLSISFLNSYKNLFLDDIKSVFQISQNILGEMIGNKNTLVKRAKYNFVNSLHNLYKIINNPNITDLKNIYKDKTALIVCAGPTLKENIEIIKENQDKFVIFALNPTLKILSQYNIKPDFIVAIESMDIIEQFSTINPEEYYFILESFVDPSVAHLNTKNTFTYPSNNNFLNNWIRDCLNIDEPLDNCGTVSYIGFISAILMGIKKIILIGQDLAYKNGSCYSKECQYGDLECIYDEKEQQYKIVVKDFDKFIQKFTSSNTDEKQAKINANNRIKVLNQNLCTVKSQDGKFLPSQNGYKLFIKNFENIAHELKINSNIELINSSCGGAQIDGFENINLKEVVKTLKPIEKLNLDNYKSHYDKNKIINKVNKLLESFKNYNIFIEKFVDLTKLIETKLEESNDFNSEIVQLIKQHRNLLKDIEKTHREEELDLLAKAHLYEIQDNINYNFTNIKEAKLIFNKTSEASSLILKLNQIGIYFLSNCKSLILK